MTEILRSEIPSLDSLSKVEITDVKHLSSYNWIETPTPTIVVPGSPPLWSPPRGSVRVTKDSGLVYTNQNAARHPDSPLEPLFVALYRSIPSFDIRTIDIVTDRNNILKLLSFVGSDPPEKSLQPFTIHVEITENTALFSRVDASNQDYIQSGEFKGFSRQFGKAYTRNKIRESTGHHRMLSYRLADLNFIIRHEGGGYTGDDVDSFTSCMEANAADELATSLGPLSLSHDSPLNFPPTSSKLTVKRDGKSVPLSRTLAIKTRAVHHRLDIQEVAAQLWLSQTPKLVRAYHRGGAFETPEVEDVSIDIKEWEAENQAQLRKLAALVHKILDAVKGLGNRASVQYDPSGDKLVILQLHRENMLPEYLYSRLNLEPGSFNSQQEEDTVPVQAPQSTKSGSIESVQVGTKLYEIDLRVMPYFESYLKSQQLANRDLPHPLKHESIELFDEVIRGLSKGPREFFCLVPNRLSEFKVLCKTLELLGVDVLESRTLRHIMDDFRSGKDDWDPDERRKIYGLKSLARDSAFRLVYMFVSNEYASELRDKGMAYNAAFFVVSHPRIFRRKTRKMVLEAFEGRFGLSDKQRKNVNKWPIEDSRWGGLDDNDETTESEDSYYADSDDWDS